MRLMTLRRMAFINESLRAVLYGSHLMQLGLHQDMRKSLDGELAGSMLRDATLLLKGDLVRFLFYNNGVGSEGQD